jgi:hypothetical protein
LQSSLISLVTLVQFARRSARCFFFLILISIHLIQCCFTLEL